MHLLLTTEFWCIGRPDINYNRIIKHQLTWCIGFGVCTQNATVELLLKLELYYHNYVHTSLEFVMEHNSVLLFKMI